MPIDPAPGAPQVESRAVERAAEFALQAGAALTICRAEGLIAFKAFAAREEDKEAPEVAEFRGLLAPAAN